MGAYLAAAAILASAALVGQAAFRVAGRADWSPAAPAIGLATLVALTSAALRLPGDATTAAVVTLVALCASLAALRGRRGWPRPGLSLAIGAGTLMATALPFAATGRIGIPGVSLNNDTATHLVWAEGLRSEPVRAMFAPSEGYPLAPHALMAVVGELTGIALDEVLIGLLIAGPVLLAWTASAAMPDLAAPLRAIAAIAVGVAYLVAAYFGQGAFKEVMLATFIAAFAVTLKEVAERPAAERPRAAVLLGLLAAGGVLTYSYLGAAWFAAGLAGWALLELAAGRPGPPELARRLRSAAPALLAGSGAMLLVLAPTLPEIVRFFELYGLAPSGGGAGVTSQTLGNLLEPLSPFAALGLWPSAEFRVRPPGALRSDGLGMAALACVLFGLAWWLRRGDRAVPGVLLGGVLIYAAARTSQSPYFLAKALAVIAPLAVLVSVRALITPAPGGIRPARGLARLAAGVGFVAVALWSSVLVLRGSPVGSTEPTAQLERLRPRLLGGDTLFLARDDYAPWALRGVRLGLVAPVSLASPVPVALRPEKPLAQGQPADFDSVTAETLDRFRYVVVPRAPLDSEPPPNFRRVAAQPLYETWERTGATPERGIVEAPGAAFAVLNCEARPRDRSLSRQAGIARVPPATVGASAAPLLGPGQVADVVLPVAPGRWTVSLQYSSVVSLRIVSGRQRWTLPANTAAPGAFFAVGTTGVRGDRLALRIIAERASRLTAPTDLARITTVAATAVAPARSVPLRSACGQPVDWYQTK